MPWRFPDEPNIAEGVCKLPLLHAPDPFIVHRKLYGKWHPEKKRNRILLTAMSPGAPCRSTHICTAHNGVAGCLAPGSPRGTEQRPDLLELPRSGPKQPLVRLR